MTDAEQAIYELLYMKHDVIAGSDKDKALDKAIAALKEQEAKHVTDPGAICPKCKMPIFPEEHPHYCGHCGRAVKWDA